MISLRTILTTIKLAGAGMLLALIVGACSSDKSTQPKAECLDENGDPLPVAPESERVDTYKPVFTNPLNVTNPLFPVTQQHSYVMLGLSDGEPFRTEVTLLPGSKTITIDGVGVQTLISQYAAFLDGRLHEVALDWYAQDNRGAVWYLGEDVFNYEEGVVANTDGTWLAGEEGPAAMIMPASPKVGDVYRPENACGVVFEEVTVKQINVTVTGPRGAVNGAIIVDELHMDATREDKIFAPDYGEFSTGSGNNIEAMALAVPTDALAGAVPSALGDLIDAADKIFDAAATSDWTAADTGLAAVNAAWTAYQANQIPPRLGTQMNTAIAQLTTAIDAQTEEGSRQSAIDVARTTYDFQLRFRQPAQIDLARFELWARQAIIDANAAEVGDVRGDVASLEWTRDRFIHTISAGTATQINSALSSLRNAANAGNLSAASAAAAQLLAVVAEIL